MINLFSALELGKNSLLAHQEVFHIIGHNISNVNTEGYSRQVPVMQSVPPEVISVNKVGRGVKLFTIKSIRDRFITNQIIERKQYEGKYDTMTGIFSTVEALFNESHELGISDQLTNFFNKWSDLANNPSDIATRNSLIDSAQSLSNNIKNTYLRLIDQQEIANGNIESLVDEINSIATEIGELNEKIVYATGAGQPASDLLDLRERKIRELSERVGINFYYNQSNNSVTIEVAGKPLVSYNRVNELSVQRDPTNSNYYDVYINQYDSAPTDITYDIENGKLEALITMRDTNIPEYKKKLDNFTYGLITNVNNIHQNGFALDTTTTGLNFFVPYTPTTPGDYTGAAGLIEVNSALVSDSTLIAASGQVDPGPPPTGAVGNNEIALQIADLMDTDNVVDSDNDGTFDYGTFHEYLHSLMSEVGNDSYQAQYELESNSSMVNYLENKRDEISGVSLDEESANLIQYEKSYQAIAQFFGMVNRLTDVLIGLGR